MRPQLRLRRGTLRKIRDLLSAVERRSALVLLGMMVVGMVLETLGIGMVIPAISLFVRPELVVDYPALQPLLEALGSPGPRTIMIGGMIMLVLLYLVKASFLAFLLWRQNRFAFGVQAHLSQRLFENYLRQSYTFHLQRNSAELLRNIVTEAQQFTFHAMLPAMLTLTEGLVLFGIVALLFAVEPVGAALVVVVTGSAAGAFYLAARRRLLKWGATRQHHEGLRIQHLQQGLGGAKDVKLLGREDEFLKQHWEHNRSGARIAEKQMTLQELPRLWLELLAVVGLATLVLAMVAQGRPITSMIPSLGLFAAAAFRLLPSVNRLLTSMQRLRYGIPVVDTLHRELRVSEPEAVRERSTESVPPGDITLRDVTFFYPSTSVPALAGVSLRIPAGSSVGFIGASGSGKSTLVDVLLGLLTPTAGEVRVGGVDIRADIRGWQDRIGYVPQTIYLTDDTLRRNIAFGVADGAIDDAAVSRAICAARLDDFVRELPLGVETMVGERGVRLSGGQRQRIGIARALYHDPAVIVLDEATSALDVETERGVMEAVEALHGSKTIVIVAHRLSTVEECDYLFRMERGRVIQHGSPAALLRRRGATS